MTGIEAPLVAVELLTDQQIRTTAILVLRGITVTEVETEDGPGHLADAVVDYLVERMSGVVEPGTDAAKVIPLVVAIEDPGAGIDIVDDVAARELYEALRARFE